MYTLYVYDIDANKVQAIITGDDSSDCEDFAKSNYDNEAFAWTYTPSFGFANGLTENPLAETIDCSE
jgi:hypothetical protein